MPFAINTPGDYTFRMHADYGSGSFMGVDGAEYTPGDICEGSCLERLRARLQGLTADVLPAGGHVEIDASTLTAGDHEFDGKMMSTSCSVCVHLIALSLTRAVPTVLGFEPCCDGHAETEVHLPCDAADDPWRTVVHGATDCMACGDAKVDGACSMDTVSAGCCGASGDHIVCHVRLEDGSCDESHEDPATAEGRFIAIPETMNIADATAYCAEHYHGIASIHSPDEQAHAVSACMKYADSSGESAWGCWIGFTDEVQEGGFMWADVSTATICRHAGV